MKKIRIGLIGLGTIGKGVAKQLIQNKVKLKKKLNFDLELVKVCDIDVKKIHKVKIPPKNFTKDANEIIASSDIDVIIELIGGIHPAKEYILRAIKNKKHVITANKALLAEEGDEIFKEAEKNKVKVCFEASVGGGIPIVKAIREALISNNISSIMGIVNGTCNYILTSMQDEGLTLKQALVKAQDKGYAERNPRLDINGIDSAHKLTILARLAFGYDLKYKEIYVEGINEISQLDISYARELGYTIKLLAISKKIGNQIEARVHPTLISSLHLLSSIKGIYNAIYVVGNLVKDMLFYGRGAGENPTTSAILADLLDVCKFIDLGETSKDFFQDKNIKGIKPISEIETKFYIRFMAIDKPGVLAKISGILGSHGISIASVTQKERRKSQVVPIIMLTHEAKEGNMRIALSKISKLNIIKKKPIAIRMES